MATAQTAAQATDPGAGLIAAPLIVLGGGEHARVVIEAARTRPERWVVQGYAAPASAVGNDMSDVPWLGDDDAVAARLSDLGPDERPWLVLGFGGGESRDGLAARVVATERFGGAARWAVVVHATAWVSPTSKLEPGAVILAQAVVNAGARVGRHAIVNSGAVVEHDVQVGEGSHVAPGAVIGGGTRVGAGTFIGLGARVRDHIEVGAGAVVGMGAVVVGSIGPGEVVVGVPARRVEPRP
ncbi:MAG TPA: NeuD/PglB/VioB family sugar acetyltransferase [Candidatus Limnocylindrales bacterium]|jgi:acetyltransferase EpsM